MKITRIEIDNVIGARHVDLKLNTPVTLVSGGNFAGKSSIRDAVAMAITGNLERIKLKNQLGQIITEGSKAGGAVITTANGNYSFTLPKGDFQADEGLPTGGAVAMAIDGQRFATMDEKERRQFILAVSGTRATQETIKQRLIDRELNAEKIESVLPMLRTGFAGACDFAKDEAKKLKGAWKQVTSDNWGSTKSAGWVAEKPDPVTTDYTDADIVAINGQVGVLNQEIGSLKAQAQQQAANATKLANLKTDAGELEERQARLVRLTADRDAMQVTVDDLRAKATGKRVGLVHDFAVFVMANTSTGCAWEDEAAELMKRYESEYGSVVTGTADPEAVASLPDNEKGLAVLETSITNLNRDIERSKAATEELAGMESTESVDYDSQVAALNQKKLSLTGSMDKIRAELEAANSIKQKIESADQRTTDALAKHESIMQWLAIADALEPTGIPSELLSDALKPLNAALSQAAAHSGWKCVMIDKDVNIVYGEFEYNLISGSEQWRVDAMIAYAVAAVSGLRLMIMDRMDTLEPSDRPAMLGWMDSLANDGLIDTALVFAMLKEPASGLPSTIAQHWIEKGVVETLREAA